MKSVHSNNEIVMPLTIGASQLLNPNKQFTVLNSLDYHLSLNLTNTMNLKNFIHSQSSTQPFLCNYQLNPLNQIIVKNHITQDLLSLSLNHQNHQFLIHKHNNSNNHANTHSTNNTLTTNNTSDYHLSFKVLISPHSKDKLKLSILQQNVCFQLIKLNSNIKFVKNTILNQLLSPKQQQFPQFNCQTQGLLTMDQSSRFLLESLQMPFPVIGFWIKTEHDNIEEIELLQHLSSYMKTKYSKKCFFKTNQSSQNYFYFIKITPQFKMETFLVSWKLNSPISKTYLANYSTNTIKISSKNTPNLKTPQPLLHKIPQSLLSKKLPSIPSQNETSQTSSFNTNHFIISSENSSNSQNSSSSNSNSSIKSQQNGMNFTLRKYHNNNQPPTLESLINYSYLSPIKQLDTNQKSPDSLFSETYQNSPQFSTLMKHQPETNECTELRAKVQSQEIQIMKLKEIIAEMQSELKLYKNSRMSTHYESNRKKPHFTSGISSPESNLFSMASNPPSKNSSPRVVGRLRESDLKSNSASRSGDWLKNSSNKKGLGWKCESDSSGGKDDSANKNTLDIFDKVVKPERLENFLPEIREEDCKEEGKDPWEYMELIDD